MRGQSPVEVRVSAKVRRADGTVEDLGQIGYYHRSPLRRARHRIQRKLRHVARSK